MEMFKELEEIILNAYQTETTLTDAERYAARFLLAQMQVSNELRKYDLDARMRKTGVKALRAVIYMEAATKDPKKPSDVMLEAIVNMNDLVAGEQRAFDESEAARNELERYYNIFREAHLYFRNLSKNAY